MLHHPCSLGIRISCDPLFKWLIIYFSCRNDSYVMLTQGLRFQDKALHPGILTNLICKTEFNPFTGSFQERLSLHLTKEFPACIAT